MLQSYWFIFNNKVCLKYIVKFKTLLILLNMFNCLMFVCNKCALNKFDTLRQLLSHALDTYATNYPHKVVTNSTLNYTT